MNISIPTNFTGKMPTSIVKGASNALNYIDTNILTVNRHCSHRCKVQTNTF